MSPTSSASSSKDASPSAPASLPPKVRAPATFTPAKRAGKTTSKDSLTKATASGKRAATYAADKVSVGVTKITNTTVTEMGRGAQTGIPLSLFTVRIVNSGSKSLALSSVIVTCVSGAQRVLCPPTYASQEVRDFSGDLKAGGSATAIYGFSVPPSELAKVQIVVDIDSTRAPAVLTVDAA